MKILLSAYACDPDRGSEAGNGWNWALHLAKEGHEVWVLTGDPLGDQARRIEHSTGLDNLHFLELPVPQWSRPFLHGMLGVYFRYFLWLRQTYKVGRGLVESQRFDLAHHVSWGSIFFGSPLWRLGIPFVLGPVGGGQTSPHSLMRYMRGHSARERVRNVLVRVGTLVNPLARGAIRNADVVFATNSETVRQARALGGRTVQLIASTAVPPPLAGRTRPRKTEAGAISILWLARLLPRKGLPLALDALSRIGPDVNWRCSIVGSGPLADEVQGWLDHYGVGERATWVGRIPWTEIDRAYDQADVFLFTSLRDSLGAQLYEAAAFGLPIIGLNHQGVADLIPDDVGVKVRVAHSDETARALAQAIEQLAKDPARLGVMSEAALSFARQNTWPIRVREAYSTIEASLADRAAR